MARAGPGSAASRPPPAGASAAGFVDGQIRGRQRLGRQSGEARAEPLEARVASRRCHHVHLPDRRCRVHEAGQIAGVRTRTPNRHQRRTRRGRRPSARARRPKGVELNRRSQSAGGCPGWRACASAPGGSRAPILPTVEIGKPRRPASSQPDAPPQAIGPLDDRHLVAHIFARGARPTDHRAPEGRRFRARRDPRLAHVRRGDLTVVVPHPKNDLTCRHGTGDQKPSAGPRSRDEDALSPGPQGHRLRGAVPRRPWLLLGLTRFADVLPTAAEALSLFEDAPVPDPPTCPRSAPAPPTTCATAPSSSLCR